MKTGVILNYDGTFNGFLCAVFRAFEEQLNVVDIQPGGKCQNEFFAQTLSVTTEIDRAKQVWFTLRDKNYESLKNIYFAFLSEVSGIELQLYREIVGLIKSNSAIGTKPSVSSSPALIAELASQVAKEKRATETRLALNFPKGKAPVAYLKPKYNILPLISKYFRLNYPTKPWIIYDQIRNFGLYYDGIKVNLVREVPAQFQFADAA